MIKTKYPHLFFSFFTLCFFIVNAPVQVLAEVNGLQKQLDQVNSYIENYRHFEAVEILQTAIAQADDKHPSLHMRLGILYYGLGLLPEAIEQGKQAVTLAPSSKWYNFDLAKFYYAANQLDNSELQVKKLLNLDPGFTLGYYYLAKIYTHKKEYDRAWLCLQRAKLLGFQGMELLEKLQPLSSQPKEDLDLAKKENSLFRFIETSDEQNAKEMLKKIQTGSYFENIELERIGGKKPTTHSGLVLQDDLSEEAATALKDSSPYAPPVIVSEGFDYRVIQRILPFDKTTWDKLTQPQMVTKQGNSTPTINPPTTTVPQQNEKTKKTSQNLSYKLAAMYAVENWQMAWAEQNVAEYLDAYSNNFTPADALSLNAWKIKRKASLTRPSYITIEIKDLVIEMIENNQMVATFIQSYQSDRYADTVRKKLILEKENEGWRIIAESEIEKLSHY